MKKLRRDEKVRLFSVGGKNFEVRNRADDVVLDSDSDYFIYMKNVNFRSGNIIEGRYLGDLTDDSPILDDKCNIVDVDGIDFRVKGKLIRTARMVAVNNKTKIVVIIED
jgi:hypothetical protein